MKRTKLRYAPLQAHIAPANFVTSTGAPKEQDFMKSDLSLNDCPIHGIKKIGGTEQHCGENCPARNIGSEIRLDFTALHDALQVLRKEEASDKATAFKHAVEHYLRATKPVIVEEWAAKLPVDYSKPDTTNAPAQYLSSA